MITRLPSEFAACVIALALTVAGCGQDEGWRRGELPSRPQNGEVQIVNLMPDSPAIDATIGSGATSVEFANASPEIGLGIGDYELSVSYLDANGESVSVIDREAVELADEDKYIYLFRDSIAQPTIETQHFLDRQYGGAVELGTIELWVANSATAVTGVDVYVTEPDAPLAGATPLTTVAAGGTSEVFTLEHFDPMQLRITSPDTATVLFDSGPFQPFNGTRSLVAIVDYFGPSSASQTTPTVNAFRVTPSGRQGFPNADLPSQMRVIDLIADVAFVDVYFGSTSATPFVGALAPLQVSTYGDVNLGQRALNVTRTGIRDQFLVQADLTLNGGNFYTLLLAGSAANDNIIAFLGTAQTREVEGRVTVQFMNAAAGLGRVTLYLLNPGGLIADASPLVTGASLGNSSTLTIRPTIFDVVVTTGPDGNVLYGPERVEFEAGKSYVLVLLEEIVGATSSAQLQVLADGG